jgi:transposase
VKEENPGRSAARASAAGETPERSTVSSENATTTGSAVPAGAVGGPLPRRLAPPRLRLVDRQRILPLMTLDQLIEADHPARDVWRFVEGLDLSLLYDRVRSRVNTPGRPATDPRVFVALWLYAILYGVISARRLEELSIHHNAFRWLRGGVPLNHHMLSDFLVEHLDFLEKLFTHSVAVLQCEGLVNLDRVGQDGVRVRASAGSASFRREETLQRLLQQTQAQVDKLQQQTQAEAETVAEQDDSAEQTESDQSEPPSARKQGARKRAAEERLERVQHALGRIPEMAAKKDEKDKKEARVSTTDAEATVMKMGDGGYRPAYNIQYSTTCDNKVIVGVEVATIGSDQGQLPPMLDQIEERFESRPSEALVDGGFANHKDIEKVQSGEGEKKGSKVYAPVAKPKKEGVDRHAPHAGDSEQVAEWRQRMGTDEAKEIYKQRAATAELVNAQARNRGLIRLLVRGVQKVKAVALWFATAHNLARAFALIPPQSAAATDATPALSFVPVI